MISCCFFYEKKKFLLHLNFQHMIFPQNHWCGILWYVGRYAHILFVLKENPSRRVNLTPLSTHDWKTRTPSSWSKQCSTRFQISLWKVDKKQLFWVAPLLNLDFLLNGNIITNMILCYDRGWSKEGEYRFKKEPFFPRLWGYLVPLTIYLKIFA